MIKEKQAEVLQYHEGSIMDILEKDSVPLYLSHVMDENDETQAVILIARYPKGIAEVNKFFVKLGADIGDE